MTGVVILLAAILLSVVAAALVSWKDGRFAKHDSHHQGVETLTPADLGIELGERATMVQFSSAFCSPCRATRVLLTDIAAKVDGVVAVDIDAEEHLPLVRRFHVMRTPTVLVLDADGRVTTRASGLPRREQVLVALGEAVGDRR
jgi:thiol-disulfide isomerase/thioredoxin